MMTLKQAGVSLCIVSLTLIAAWAVYSMIQSSEAPLPIRIGVIGTILGAAFVLISLIGERSKEEEVDVGRKY